MQNKCKRVRSKAIAALVNEIRDSNFYQVDFKASLNRCLECLGERKIEQIVCYGLGSFSDGVEVASRYQLALLLLLYECLIEQGSPLSPMIEVYDPSFQQTDKETLRSYGRPKFSLLTENEYCARKLSASHPHGCVLFYMPHLDKYLYNNLLGANWDRQQLGRLVLLGNSFQEMIDNEIETKCRSNLHFMNLLVQNFAKLEYTSAPANGSRKKGKRPATTEEKALQKALIEVTIDDRLFGHSDVFNSLAFHLIDESWLDINSMRLEQNSLPNWSPETHDHPADPWTDD